MSSQADNLQQLMAFFNLGNGAQSGAQGGARVNQRPALTAPRPSAKPAAIAPPVNRKLLTAGPVDESSFARF